MDQDRREELAEKYPDLFTIDEEGRLHPKRATLHKGGGKVE